MDVISIGETMVLFTPNTLGKIRYANQYTSRIAGAETNTLIGLAKLGHQAGWISRLGRDEFGEQILNTVRGEGVDVSKVVMDDGAPTGILFKEILNQDSVNIYYYRKDSAASKLSPNDLDKDYIANAKFLYLSGITPALSPSCRKTVFESIDMAKDNGLKIVFDPNIRRKLWKEEEARKVILEIAGKSDVILPGISECEFLFGTREYTQAVQSFHELGVETVIVKLGDKGAYYSTFDSKGYIDSYPVKAVIDPVGAGDGFAAGVLSGFLDNLPISESVKRGCAIGAMVCSTNGDIEGLPSKRELHQFYNSNFIDEVNR
ncbi:sugar kinase [Niallia sp. FSL W8-0635]|uniref:sugar kinase n=1 Tax=Niallia sp. FSL W8-0635 TaxID=2975337 RepID=UPI0030F65EFB